MTADKPEEKTVTEIFDEVKMEVCSNLCKYLETCDDDETCDYVREHGECPLDRL